MKQADFLATFRPRLLDALAGYTRERFIKDLGAGLTVGIVALPLAMAFAIASGLKPEAGIWTAILAGAMVAALGGANNIRAVDPVALTRLRVEVTDAAAVDEAALQAAGVQGLMRLQDDVLHLVIGLNAEQYAGEMAKRLGTKV